LCPKTKKRPLRIPRSKDEDNIEISLKRTRGVGSGDMKWIYLGSRIGQMAGCENENTKL
jgi:hypothetical protein